MKLDYPGIGGSLGECVLCGKSFAFEVITGRNVRMLGIEGFDRDLPIHEKCMDVMEGLRGKDWTSLPDGPLRTEYASVHAATPEPETPTTNHSYQTA